MNLRFYLAGGLALLLQACSSPQYVQPVEVPLKQEPQGSATLALLPIGTPCELLRKENNSRLKVRCRGTEGYVPVEGVGPQKPVASQLLEAAAKPGLDPRERLDHAVRAAVLDPDTPQVLATLKQLYLDYQFSRLPANSDGRFAPEQPLLCTASARIEDCLANILLPPQAFTARLIQRQGQRFVGMGVRGGYLYAVRGTLNEGAGADSGASFVLRSQEFESNDVPLITRALGLKGSEDAEALLQYVSDGERNFSRMKTGSRLEAREGSNTQLLVDLEKHIPPGKKGEIRLDLRGNILLQVLFVGDFDSDGRDDALVKVDTGGNCCESGYLFVSVPRKGEPVVTKVFGNQNDDPIIGAVKGSTSFTLTNEDGQKTYVFDHRRAQRVAGQPFPTFETVFQYTAEQLWKLAEDTGKSPDSTTESLEYDLDDDGQAELIECKGWERWNGLMCDFYRADRKRLGTVGGCKRVGVLSNKTQGMHDLLCDKNTVVQWNGTAYP